MDCTLLQCFFDQGRITAVTPVYQNIECMDSEKTLTDALIRARQTVVTDLEKKSALLPDQLLMLKGRAEPILTPEAFNDVPAGEKPFRYRMAGSWFGSVD